MEWRRTALRLVLICYAIHPGAAKPLDVVWTSPPEGIVYQPGDTIIGKWTPTMPLVSPSFKLCQVPREPPLEGRGGDGEENSECGMDVWLQAQELQDGYSVVLPASETSRESKFRLQVQDDLGNVFMSPVFGLGIPSDDKNPAGRPATKVLELLGNTLETAEHSSGSKLGGSSGLIDPTAAMISSPRIAVPSSPSTPLDVHTSRRLVPTAAFAVPLSAVAGIIIVTSLLFLNNRRKLAKTRRELKTLILSKHSGESEEFGQVKRVLSHKGVSEYYDASEPLPVAFPRPEPRVATRSPFAAMGSYSSSSTIFDDGLGNYYGEEPTVKGKSLTDQYTAAGTKLRSEDSTQPAPAIPSPVLPTRISPAHIRSHSFETIHSLPFRPAFSAISTMEADDAFRISTADGRGN